MGDRICMGMCDCDKGSEIRHAFPFAGFARLMSMQEVVLRNKPRT